MLLKKVGLVILIAVLSFMVGQNAVHAVETAGEEEKVFLKILDAAYRVSCQDVESLREYYLQDAEIINNGRQVTLDETIKELKQSLSSLTGLTCSYQPKLRTRRIGKELAYIVVRETIRFSADEMEKQQEIQQICTYVFLKTGSGWKIAHDHCSSIPGLTV